MYCFKTDKINQSNRQIISSFLKERLNKLEFSIIIPTFNSAISNERQNIETILKFGINNSKNKLIYNANFPRISLKHIDFKNIYNSLSIINPYFNICLQKVNSDITSIVAWLKLSQININSLNISNAFIAFKDDKYAKVIFQGSANELQLYLNYLAEKCIANPFYSISFFTNKYCTLSISDYGTVINCECKFTEHEKINYIECIIENKVTACEEAIFNLLTNEYPYNDYIEIEKLYDICKETGLEKEVGMVYYTPKETKCRKYSYFSLNIDNQEILHYNNQSKEIKFCFNESQIKELESMGFNFSQLNLEYNFESGSFKDFLSVSSNYDLGYPLDDDFTNELIEAVSKTFNNN